MLSKAKDPSGLKTPKFQRLNGWDTSFTNDTLDIVAWVHLQTAIQTKKDTKKPKITTEELTFRHLPKRRCPSLENDKEYEKQSLHKHFFIREKEETTKLKRSKTILSVSTTTVPARARPAGNGNNNTESNSKENTSTEQVNDRNKSKSKDDIDVHVHKNEHFRNLNSIFPSKRSRSVPVQQAAEKTTEHAYQNPSYRRLLYYARKYGSKEDIIYDEGEGEDEGYGSKTPSAEDKDIKEFDSADHFGFWNCESGVNDNKVIQPKVAKFSYTHQVPKSHLYDESEDEKVSKSDIQVHKTDIGIKYYKTGYVNGTENEFVKRMLSRSNTTLSTNYESTQIYPIDDLKPAMILRKITIQDSQGEKTQGTTEKSKSSTAGNESKDVYEPHKTIVRQSSFVQSDRAQYPIYCTSPELKFSQTTNSRPGSKKSARGSRQENHSSKGNQQELLNRTKGPYLDFYRSHTAVCMPIGDLLPAVDRNIRNRSNSKTKSGVQVAQTMAQSMPDIPNSLLTPRKPNEETAPSDPHEKTKDTCNSVSTSPSEARVRLTTTKPKEGTDSSRTTKLELSMSGVDIEIKREKGYNAQRTKTYGKVLLSASPDKDTKKKLRDAFSRFYNRQPYGSNIGKKNWHEELKYIWKT